MQMVNMMKMMQMLKLMKMMKKIKRLTHTNENDEHDESDEHDENEHDKHAPSPSLPVHPHACQDADQDHHHYPSLVHHHQNPQPEDPPNLHPLAQQVPPVLAPRASPLALPAFVLRLASALLCPP